MSLALIRAPSGEPLTVAEVKQHLRVDADDQNAVIQRLIGAARRKVEAETGRALLTQTWEWSADRWPRAGIWIPMAPVASITNVKYVDTTGALVLWSSLEWQADLESPVARIVPAYGYCWPTERHQLAAVRVRFVAGYGAAAAVPEDLKAAMLLIIGHLYEHREDVADFQVHQVPRAADYLLAPYRLHTF